GRMGSSIARPRLIGRAFAATWVFDGEGDEAWLGRGRGIDEDDEAGLFDVALIVHVGFEARGTEDEGASAETHGAGGLFVVGGGRAIRALAEIEGDLELG